MRLIAVGTATLALSILPSLVTLARAQEGRPGGDGQPAPGPTATEAPPTNPRPVPVPPPIPAPPRAHMNSPKLMVAGIVLGTLGTPALIGGAVMAARPVNNPCPTGSGAGCAVDGIFTGISAGVSKAPYVLLAILGSLLWTAGAVMTPVGAMPVRTPSPSEQALITIGPGSARVTLPF